MQKAWKTKKILTHKEREKFLCVVVHEKFDRVQTEQHLARAVARRHVKEQLKGLRHHLVITRPVLQVVPDLGGKKRESHHDIVSDIFQSGNPEDTTSYTK